MSNEKLCKFLYNGVICSAPTDGTIESLKYGLEVARELLTDSENNKCGLTVNENIEHPDLTCEKSLACCSLSKILKIN